MNFSAILAIFRKDLLDGAKNYHVILMVLTPIVLSLLFSNIISDSKTAAAIPEIGMISSPQQPLIESLSGKGFDKKITFYQNRETLESAILEGDVKFGIILPELISEKAARKPAHGVTILFPPHMPEFGVETLKSVFENEIRNQLNLLPPPLPFKLITEPVAGTTSNAGNVSDTMFPMLIVMAIGMVGFLALPMAIVEEREKGTLNAIFLTSITPGEFILGKSLFSFFMCMATIVIMLTINAKWGINFHYILVFAFLGALMTIFTGLIIASFVQTQGSVNAVGTTLFLFFQMIPSLQHTSELARKVAPFFPSTYIFSGLRKAMFLDLTRVTILDDISIVLAVTALLYLTAWAVYRLKKADK
jgi:ABC-2 type transport system permease protein